MTPTLDELIAYQTTIAGYWSGSHDSRDALLNNGILHALQRLRELEAIPRCEFNRDVVNSGVMDVEDYRLWALGMFHAWNLKEGEEAAYHARLWAGLVTMLTNYKDARESYDRLYDATTPMPFGDRVVSFVDDAATVKDSLTVQPPDAPAYDSGTIGDTPFVAFAGNDGDAFIQRLRDEAAAGIAPVKDSLTTAPRPGAPTVEEVGDDDKCWVWSAGDEELSPCWYPFHGSIARKWASFFTHWLPYDAIPMPEGEE